MNSTAEYISYQETNAFSKIVIDYLQKDEALKPFYNYEVSIDGIKEAIEERKKYATNTFLLVEVLKEQYAGISLTPYQQKNIDLLTSANTFTITTAHQPNIFTGPLYFIYKILHAIKLAEFCAVELPQNNFVPIYYMGSEDADLEELNHIFINGEKKEWKTNQTGAVGRMKVDEALLKLINDLAGQLAVLPYGNEIIDELKKCYQVNATIEQATFKFVNFLFAHYGLLIVLPDNAKLKKAFIQILKKEITEQFSAKAVQQTVTAFPHEYKVQASGRAINLFYLLDDKRERIEKVDDQFVVVNTSLKFTEQELLKEIDNHPERFSPNVILRPIFQETILPNVAFIGGGGELAYWLELKKVFEEISVPYPLIMLRNSFLLVNEEQQKLMYKLNVSPTDLFKPLNNTLNEIVRKESKNELSLSIQKNELQQIYSTIKSLTYSIDKSLLKHTEALQTKALNKLDALEKKMLKAEKKKFEAQQRQIAKLKNQLFPKNNLQERVENVLIFYSQFGNVFIEDLLKNSLSTQQNFTVIKF
jgi:bacillithiol synthase